MASIHNYGGITPEGVDRLRTALAEEGISLPAGNTGTIEYNGVTVSFRYQPEMNTLRLSLDKKPFFVTEDQVWNILDEAIEPHANA